MFKFNGVGSTNPNSKLTRSQVQEIRILFALGYTLDQISQQFGVSRGHISKIVNRKHWK